MLNPKKEKNIRALTFISSDIDMEQIEKLYSMLNIKKTPKKILITNELLFGKYNEIITGKQGLSINCYLHHCISYYQKKVKESSHDNISFSKNKKN